MSLRATITCDCTCVQLNVIVSPSHYNKFRYHKEVGAIKAALCGQKLKLLIRGIVGTAESACIKWRMLYKSPCKTALKTELSLPEFSGISEDDFHCSQSTALRYFLHFNRKPSLFFPQKV